MTKTWLLAVLAIGCVDAGDEIGEHLETTEQEVSSIATATWGTTTDLVGYYTAQPTTSRTCVLTKVLGDLGEGGYWEVKDEPSFAGVVTRVGEANYSLVAHGGAYTNQTNDRVWANNRVMAGTVCVPYPRSAEAIWQTVGGGGVASPKKIASLATNRRCFLRSVLGGGMIFTHAGDFVRVRKITTVDSTHPTTGWYVEGNLKSNPFTGQPASAGAYCIDFPTITNEWSASVVGNATETITSGNGVKMCGLTRLVGAFNVDSYSDGVKLNHPTSATANWSMTVSTGKVGDALCIE